MAYDNELLFENDLITFLYTSCGWEKEVLKYPTEEDLINNWANILFNSNNTIDCLNNCPLTSGEMRQIMNLINDLKSPYELNSKLINAGTVTIIRENEDDELHYHKPVTLKIYDKTEIANGKSRYQIVEQPKFKTTNPIFPNRRGDIMLLINGMPLFHIELKKSNIDISQAENQIEKYMANNAFTGIFSLVQIFIAMNPEDAVYYANPGPDGKFNPLYYFHWTDSQNNYIKEWNKFAYSLLMIPRAHELIGFYTVPDASDGKLKVLRPYQIYAADNIFDKVSKSHWTKSEQKAGYVWHTTGSGKTLTSFKTAQLIAKRGVADKVVFLIDRVELGEQSYLDYKNFANVDDSIYDTSNTDALIRLLKSDDSDEKVIISSIQKMGRIADGDASPSQINKIKSKKVVFIIDECHRDQNGLMHQNIESVFPNAMFFGFTGTPDHKETVMIFGDELHRYTIAHAVRPDDHNVLGFDRYKICVFKDSELREKVGLKKANAKTVEEALTDPKKRRIFEYYMNKGEKECSMLEIESDVPVSQFETDKYRKSVAKDIIDNWLIRSSNSLFHAIFATSSIKEAILYYYLFTENETVLNNNLKVTAIFDPSEDNGDDAAFKMGGITRILTDYNKMFGVSFKYSRYSEFKKDVCRRLAHKEPYKSIDKDKQINIVIVVDQLLTGFDSKWINTVYLDKILQGKNFIQAASRTNRLFGPEKKHGTIVWYRYPHTTEKLFDDAIAEYSGNKPLGVLVNRLEKNLNSMNRLFNEIKEHFELVGIKNFEKIYDDLDWKIKFQTLFSLLNSILYSAKLQGFFWKQLHYEFKHDDKASTFVDVKFDENIYLTLVQRYKELFTLIASGDEEPPFAIDPYIIEIQSDRIDYNYLNSRFKQFVKDLNKGDLKAKKKALDDLHKSFAFLSQEDQTFARQFLNDVENGLAIEEGKNFTDYIAEYKTKARNDEVYKISSGLGINEEKFKELLNLHPTEANLNAFNRYDELFDTLDIDKAKVYLEGKLDTKFKNKREVKMAADAYLRKVLLNGI